MIDTDSLFFRYGLIAVIVVAFMWAVKDSREVVPVVAEKTYLTKTVPHEGRKGKTLNFEVTSSGFLTIDSTAPDDGIVLNITTE